MRTINRYLEIIIGNIGRDPRANSSPQRSKPLTNLRLAMIANKRMLILFALILLPVFAGCTRDIGSESDGWNPPVSSDGVVYVATKDGEVKAFIDDGSGNLQVSWTFPSSLEQNALIPPRTATSSGVHSRPAARFGPLRRWIKALPTSGRTTTRSTR